MRSMKRHLSAIIIIFIFFPHSLFIHILTICTMDYHPFISNYYQNKQIVE